MTSPNFDVTLSYTTNSCLHMGISQITDSTALEFYLFGDCNVAQELSNKRLQSYVVHREIAGSPL